MAVDRRAPAANSPAWEITPAGKTPGLGAVVRIGARAVPLADVRGFVGSVEPQADHRPALAVLAVFGSAAVLFLVVVFDFGWRERFVLGAVVFGAIGATALNDLTWLSQGRLYRVEMRLASGERLRYTCLDPADQQRLLTALGQHMLSPGERGAGGREAGGHEAGGLDDAARRRVVEPRTAAA
jgi:hypothetical protein